VASPFETKDDEIEPDVGQPENSQEKNGKTEETRDFWDRQFDQVPVLSGKKDEESKRKDQLFMEWF
jgi:hypothetical protein